MNWKKYTRDNNNRVRNRDMQGREGRIGRRKRRR